MNQPTLRRRLGPVTRLDDRIAPAALTFAIDPTQSSLALSGSVLGFSFSPQGAGSLTTTFSGTAVADIDLTANTIGFTTAGSVATAAISGNWQPTPGGAAGSAPANYGGQIPFVGVVAVRNGTGGLSTTAPLALSGTGATRSFPSTQTVTLLTGDFDYNAGSFGTGTTSAAGFTANNAAAAGSFADVNDGTARLTAPVNATFTVTFGTQSATYNFNGALVGTAPFPTADLNGPAAGTDATTTFTAGGPAVSVAPNTEVRRSPAVNLTSATAILTNRPNGAAEVLGINLAGTGLSSTGYNTTTGALTITGAAPLATYQSVLRTLTYSNTAGSATPGARAITVTVNDGTFNSLPHTATVNVALAPRVTSVQTNNGAAQKSMVTSIQVAFSTVVGFATTTGAAFTLTRIGGGVVNFTATPATVGGVTVVTLTGFTGTASSNGSLADGRYTLTALATQITANGLQLDGDGNGTAGDDFVFADAGPGTTTGNQLFRLFGDANGDRVVNTADLNFFRIALGGPASDITFDSNLDGIINAADLNAFRVTLGGSV